MDGARQKILIVEDDHDAALAVAIILQRRGYEVVTAFDANSAVTMAEREEPDLILLDIGLPGVSGFTVLERVRTLFTTSHTPVIVLTGLDVSRQDAREAGAQDLLLKPVDSINLIGAIAKALPE